MTALFSIRGFFHVGNSTTPINAFPNDNVKSLAALFEEIPDAFVQDVQMYFAKNFKDTYNEDGFKGLFKQLTGIDTRLIDHILGQGEELSLFETAKYGLEAFDGATKRLPEFIGFLEELSADIPNVLKALVKHDYLTEHESEIVYIEYINILTHLQQIEEIIKQGISFTHHDIGSIIMDVMNHYGAIMNSIDIINTNTKKLQEQLQLGVDAHMLKTTLKGLIADSDISYKHIDGTFDRIISKKVNGKDIKINMSSAVRMYTEGLSILENKQTVLDEIKSLYEQNYLQSYTNREERIMKVIRDMEESPYSYQSLMGNFTSDTNVFHRVTKIEVPEDIPKLPEDFTVIFEGIFNYIESVITKEKELLQKIKESIEELFEEDKRIAETVFGTGR